MRYLTLLALCIPMGLWAQTTTESVDINEAQVTQSKLEAWKRNSYELIPQKEPVYREPTQQKSNKAGIPKGYVSYPSPLRVSAGFGYGYGYGYGAPYNYNPYAYEGSYGYYPYNTLAFTNPAQFAVISGLNYLLNPEARRYWRGSNQKP